MKWLIVSLVFAMSALCAAANEFQVAYALSILSLTIILWIEEEV